MGEEIVSAIQKFMHFYTTQWAILGNLFKANANLYNLQTASPEFDNELAKALAAINETLSLTISTFNKIISKISEYREISADAFAFLRDDLDRAIKVSSQIAESVSEGYSEAAKAHVTILQSKLDEIAEKASQHLEARTSEG